MTSETYTKERVDGILHLVAQQNASDIHFVVGRHPTLRISGKLYSLEQEQLLTPDHTKAISSVLLTESMHAALLRDGHADFSYSYEEKARFRVNIFFQKGYISIVMRLIPTKVRTLEELGVPPMLYKFTEFPQGLVLVTGPVGHGKSTTLAALIDHINRNQSKSILTIEDPIEYVYAQDQSIINQREIGQDAKDFSSALKAVFREDINVVLIGELRDLETISLAMTAAETGHLIFATLHTNDASQTIDRIVDVFSGNQQNQIRSQLANVLLGVVSQRLLPSVDGGRVPALELLLKNHAVENLIRENKSFQIDSVIETHLKDGMVPMDLSLADLVQRNVVSLDDAQRYAKNQERFMMFVHRQ